jgi:hypothetical protein
MRQFREVYKYHHVTRFLNYFIPLPSPALILSALLSWDRVINRHSGEQAAYGSRVWLSRRAETLSHVPPGLRTLYLKRYMRQPGQKAVTGRVASHTRHR